MPGAPWQVPMKVSGMPTSGPPQMTTTASRSGKTLAAATITGSGERNWTQGLFSIPPFFLLHQTKIKRIGLTFHLETPLDSSPNPFPSASPPPSPHPRAEEGEAVYYSNLRLTASRACSCPRRDRSYETRHPASRSRKLSPRRTRPSPRQTSRWRSRTSSA